MKKQLLATAAALGMTVAGVTAPANAAVPLTLNLGYGQWYFDGDRDLIGGRELKDTTTPWVSLEYAFGDHWATEILYAEDETRYKDGPDADVLTWQLGVLRYAGSYISDRARLRPYFGLSAGEIYIDADAFDTKETNVGIPLGVRWMFGSRFGMRFEWRPMYSLDEERWDSMISVGLNLYTGRVKPEVVAVAAPLDSDGDGVTDDIDQCPNTAPGVRVDAVGCPMPVTEIASIKLMVNFGFDSTKVEEKYFNDLGELAEFLKRFEDVGVDIEGHTDSSGPEDYNQQLSQRRSQAVVDMLVNEYGIAPERLEAVGYGESQPVADNSTAEGREENRRVMATLEVEYEN